MKLSMSLKIVQRSIILTILIVLILAVMTFMWVSQLVEYVVLNREVYAAAQSYMGIATVEASEAKTDPRIFNYLFWDERVDADEGYLKNMIGGNTQSYEKIPYEQIENIIKMPYVANADLRYMTGGIIEDRLRIDDGGEIYNYNAICVIEGTLCREPHNNITPLYYELRFDDCKLLAGENRGIEGGSVDVTAVTNKANTYGGSHPRALYISHPDYPYGEDFVKNLKVGSRYVFVVHYEPLITHYDTFVLGDYVTETWCNTFWEVDGEPADYIEKDEYEDLRVLIDTINTGQNTFDVVYTKDMNSIMRFANGDMVIIEGRKLVPKDSENNANVCVISRSLAKYGYGVGDTISISLGNELFEQYLGLGAVPAVPTRLSDSYTEVELEIVGIYSDVDTQGERAQEPNWAYSASTIFVPLSLLQTQDIPKDSYAPGEISFTINAWDIRAFLDETAPKIEELGVTLMFEDQGWLEIEENFEDSIDLAKIRIAILSAAIIASIWFAVYVYIVNRRKDYAIMRVLGTTKNNTNRAIITPLMVVAIASVLFGTIVALIYTHKTIAENNTLVAMSKHMVDTNIPIFVVLVGAVCEVLLILLIAYVLLAGFSKKPLLEMLSSSNKARKQKSSKETENQPLSDISYSEELDTVMLNKNEKAARRFILKYSLRHIRRTPLKSLMIILVVILLLNVIGQINIMKTSYDELFDSTVITSNYVGGLTLDKALKLEESGYVKDMYYSASTELSIDNYSVVVVITNDITRYVSDEVTVTGESPKLVGNSVVLSKDIAWANELSLGDKVVLAPAGILEKLQMSFVDNHRKQNPNDARSDVEIAELYQAEIESAYYQYACELTVVGILNTEEIAGTVFVPGVNSTTVEVGLRLPLEVVEATVADNALIDEYDEYARNLCGGGVAGGITFAMDTTKIENVKNILRLLEMLYPMAIVMAVAICGIMSGLTIVQTSKDIAIMRVLGTSKAKTRTILILEQMILCVIGIIISGIILHMRDALMQMLWIFGVYALVILLASGVAAVFTSRKKVLELLQTKE